MTVPAFILGVWQQPWSSAPKWLSRGVNTLYGHEGEQRYTKAEWEAQVGKVMNFISAPGADVAAESTQPGRIGFNQPDEPDGTAHQALPGNTLADLANTYARVKAVSSLPVFANFQGSAFDNVAYDGRKFRTDIKQNRPYWHNAADGGYFADADVIGFDYHLWTTGRPGAFDITKRLMDRANDWSGGKPIFVYVETCTQGTGKPFTADDYENQVWTIVNYAKAKAYKLAGIVYFTQKVYPGWGSFDMTDPAVVERMITVNAKLNQMFNSPAPAPQPAPDPVAALTQQVADLKGQLDAQGRTIADVTAKAAATDAKLQAVAKAIQGQ